MFMLMPHHMQNIPHEWQNALQATLVYDDAIAIQNGKGGSASKGCLMFEKLLTV